MEEENLYRSIYEYLLAHIYFGYYPEEKHLPSIHTLGSLFGVSTITVRSAFRLLEQEGYITSSKNKRTEILPDLPGQPREFPGQFLLDEASQKDVYRSCQLLFPMIYYCGLNAYSEQKLPELCLILDPHSQLLYDPVVHFQACMVKGLNNSLALNLYYDMVLFTTPTYLAVMSMEKKSRKQIYADLSHRFMKILRSRSAGDRTAMWRQIQDVCSILCSHPSPPAKGFVRSTPYRWRKQQICLSTATSLIRQVILGTYPVGSFLPSARALSEESSTAVITIRRAIVLLNDMGITETINGRGTRILPPERALEKVRWDKPSVKKNLMAYLEAVHLLAITCRRVAEAVFPRLTPQDKAVALKSMRLAQRQGRAGMFIYIYLNLLATATELSALQDIYTQLANLLILGLPLSFLTPEFHLDSCASHLASILEVSDPQLFAAVLELLLECAFLSAREKMVHIGIKEAGRMVLELR